MKNKVLLLQVLVCCFLGSCKNPFDLPLEACPGVVQEISHQTKLENSDDDYRLVQISLRVPSSDISVLVRNDDGNVLLRTSKLYDSYWWLLGDAIVSEDEVCFLNISEWTKNCYPVVLYAMKDIQVYSGMVYLDNRGKEISASFCRTVLPDLTSSLLCDIKLTIINNITGESLSSEWNSSAVLFREKQKLKIGEYTFIVSGKIGNLNFKNISVEEIKEETTKLTVTLELTDCDTMENGNLSLIISENNEFGIKAKNMSLYKWENKEFVLKSYAEITDMGTLLLEDLVQGIYWLRINGLSDDGSRHSYYAAYVYILPGVTLNKIVEFKNYWDIYEVTFDTAGGLFIGEEPVFYKAPYESFFLPGESELIKPGFSFEGWYLDEDYQFGAENCFTAGMLEANLTLYAHWLPADDIEGYLAGTGILPGRRMEISENHNCLTVKIPDAGEIDSILIDIYDMEGKEKDICINNITKADDFFLVELYSVFIEKEVYLLEITGVNKQTDKLVFKEKQFLKV